MGGHGIFEHLFLWGGSFNQTKGEKRESGREQERERESTDKRKKERERERERERTHKGALCL